MGAIFWFDVGYEDIPGESKRRPVIIVDEPEDNLLILVSTTSQSPDDPPSYYDQFKIPIPNWRKSGLSKPSWGLGFRLIEITRRDFEKIIEDKDYIGVMYPYDFNYLIRQIELMHED